MAEILPIQRRTLNNQTIYRLCQKATITKGQKRQCMSLPKFYLILDGSRYLFHPNVSKINLTISVLKSFLKA